ncbi:Uncharacterized protein SCF082_LOCUS30771, partial [Durusdinium trenchii]
MEEYCVVVKERGCREVEESHEESRRSTTALEGSQAPSIPEGTFDGLSRLQERADADKKNADEPGKISQELEATSCRAAIRTARAVVQDLGASSASKSPGLNELAKISEQNSERDVHTLTSKKFLLSIPIELTTIPKPPGIRYSGDFHAIRLRDWCRFLVDYGCWHVLVGLSRANPVREQAILREFWRRYRLWRPDHQIWRLVDCGAVDLSRTAPMILHGDEGRGFKRGAFLVAAYHSYIGRGTNLANTLRKHRSYLQMRLNYSGSSWSHRFLSTCLPKMCADTVALESLLNFMTQDALDILHKPVLDSMGNKYSMAVLQVSGDWQFLAKAGNLLRSFSTVQKKPRPDMSGAKGICHWCLAGREHVPFEDFRVTAAWRATQFLPGDQFFTSVIKRVLQRGLHATFAHFVDCGYLQTCRRPCLPEEKEGEVPADVRLTDARLTDARPKAESFTGSFGFGGSSSTGSFSLGLRGRNHTMVSAPFQNLLKQLAQQHVKELAELASASSARRTEAADVAISKSNESELEMDGSGKVERYTTPNMSIEHWIRARQMSSASGSRSNFGGGTGDFEVENST